MTTQPSDDKERIRFTAWLLPEERAILDEVAREQGSPSANFGLRTILRRFIEGRERDLTEVTLVTRNKRRE